MLYNLSFTYISIAVLIHSGLALVFTSFINLSRELKFHRITVPSLDKDFFKFELLFSGDDIKQFSDHYVEPGEHQITLSNLNLQTGIRYFSSVRAFTKTGLHTTSSSDGFRVDATAPLEGIVIDGLGKCLKLCL